MAAMRREHATAVVEVKQFDGAVASLMALEGMSGIFYPGASLGEGDAPVFSLRAAAGAPVSLVELVAQEGSRDIEKKVKSGIENFTS